MRIHLMWSCQHHIQSGVPKVTFNLLHAGVLECQQVLSLGKWKFWCAIIHADLLIVMSGKSHKSKISQIVLSEFTFNLEKKNGSIAMTKCYHSWFLCWSCEIFWSVNINCKGMVPLGKKKCLIALKGTKWVVFRGKRIHSTWYWKGSIVSAGIRTPDPWVARRTIYHWAIWLTDEWLWMGIKIAYIKYKTHCV